MSMTLPPEKNPYSGRTPFDVLGVSSTATAAEIRDAHEERIEETNDAGYEDSVRLAKLRELKEAYTSLSEYKARVGVEIFFYDKTVGSEECQKTAQRLKSFSFDFNRILQRVEDIIPCSPEVQGAEKQFENVSLQQSTRLETEGHGFAIDPRTEALQSVTFER
jgi:DnaJ-class molecular chaperone